MSEYVPTTEAVRSSFASNQVVQRGEFEFELLSEDEAGAEFDRWLAKRDAEIAAEALEAEADRIQALVRLDGVVDELSTAYMTVVDALRGRAIEYRKAVEK